MWKITILRQKIIFFPIAEGGAKFFGVFRVKNHDLTPKNLFFPIAEGGAKYFGVFRVKNHPCHMYISNDSNVKDKSWLTSLTTSQVGLLIFSITDKGSVKYRSNMWSYVRNGRQGKRFVCSAIFLVIAGQFWVIKTLFGLKFSSL